MCWDYPYCGLFNFSQFNFHWFNYGHEIVHTVYVWFAVHIFSNMFVCNCLTSHTNNAIDQRCCPLGRSRIYKKKFVSIAVHPFCARTVHGKSNIYCMYFSPFSVFLSHLLHSAFQFGFNLINFAYHVIKKNIKTCKFLMARYDYRYQCLTCNNILLLLMFILI